MEYNRHYCRDALALLTEGHRDVRPYAEIENKTWGHQVMPGMVMHRYPKLQWLLVWQGSFGASLILKTSWALARTM